MGGSENGKAEDRGSRGVVSNREMDARIRALVERERGKQAQPVSHREVEPEGDES